MSLSCVLKSKLQYFLYKKRSWFISLSFRFANIKTLMTSLFSDWVWFKVSWFFVQFCWLFSRGSKSVDFNKSLSKLASEIFILCLQVNMLHWGETEGEYASVNMFLLQGLTPWSSPILSLNCPLPGIICSRQTQICSKILLSSWIKYNF